MEINNKLLKEISEYCKLNNLNEDEFINHILKDAFMREKYGERPCIVAPTTLIENVKVEPEVIKAEEVVMRDATENPTDVEIVKPKRRSKKLESL